MFQDKLVKYVQSCGDAFPRFVILVGEQGSGRKTMCKYFAQRLGTQIAFVSTGVEDIRQMLHTAYRVDIPTMYVIADADNMSMNAKNALLKVTEETPRNAYIIMTVEDEMNTLATLRSRGRVLYMEPYTSYQLSAYVRSIGYSVESRLPDICTTPGQINMLRDVEDEFLNFVDLVIDNIATVSDANAFKLGSRIKLKDTDEDKYDLKLFWQAVQYKLRAKMDNPESGVFNYWHCAECVACTAEYIRDLKIKGINKSASLDMWIIDMRNILWSSQH